MNTISSPVQLPVLPLWQVLLDVQRFQATDGLTDEAIGSAVLSTGAFDIIG